MAMRPDDMTSEERSGFERELLAATHHAMEGGQSGFGYQFRGAELTGEYPDTTITVRYWDPRYQRERSPSYRIWKELVWEDGTLEHPAPRAAVLIKVWALGG